MNLGPCKFDFHKLEINLFIESKPWHEETHNSYRYLKEEKLLFNCRSNLHDHRFLYNYANHTF